MKVEGNHVDSHSQPVAWGDGADAVVAKAVGQPGAEVFQMVGDLGCDFR
ncbi:hypothetical protein OUY22_14045 [Nonomuraea sp. MCN248]|uniref:Uncharacterized protein n=1 Tax=Nonomuraea corallina TaxID=2989783 RepID=A0ABT4SBF8_9ACTN|nr:hypothetical protein [Nonomuraea corallina]MDA0634542.1 hypothetical protein [Nonomuraea corallina]